MVFVNRAVPASVIKEQLIEKLFIKAYNYFVSEFAKLPTSSTKVRLFNESEAMNSPALLEIWNETVSMNTAERKNIVKAALFDAWFQLPRLTKEYQIQLDAKNLVSEPDNIDPVVVAEAPKKRGPKPKTLTPEQNTEAK